MQMEISNLEWQKILDEPFVGLLLGGRGEGKTALGHRLMEVFKCEDRDVYILGFPEEKTELLPDWITVLPPTITRDTWPENSFVLVHEAHMLIHARRSMDSENLELDELVTVSRHKNSDIIYDTQQSQRLDRNAVASVDAIIVRWPALLQEKFERRGVKSVITDAREALGKYVDVKETDDYTYVNRQAADDGVDLLHRHAYVQSDRFVGEYPQEIQLPEHWTEEISRAYGDLADGSDGDGDSGDGRSALGRIVEDKQMRRVLRKAVNFERTHRDGWRAAEIGAAGSQVSSLLAAGLLDESYHNRNGSVWKLVDLDRVEEKLKETQ